MKIGIKEMIDPETRDYYEAFYDILRTPDFDDKSRVLKPLHGMKTIGYSKKKICYNSLNYYIYFFTIFLYLLFS